MFTHRLFTPLRSTRVLRYGSAAVLAGCVTLAQAETLYVQSLQAKLLAEPNFKSSLVTTLEKGQAVESQQTQGAWVLVTFEGQQGWTPKLTLKATPPLDRVTVLPGDTTVELQDVRRRTSAITTAAAARGLSDMSETEAGQTTYASDPEAVKYMEGFSVSSDELNAFAQPLTSGAVK